MVTAVDIIKTLTVRCRELLGCDVNDRDISEGFDEIVETINKADMTYITNFDVTIYQPRPEADAPYMEELAINGQQQSSEENQ